MKAPYKGKTSFDAGMFYAPHIPLSMASVITVKSIKLIYDHPDFNPRVRFNPRHCVRIDPNSRVSPLTKLKFFRDATKWCQENAGIADKDWVIETNYERLWFRDKNIIVLFKMTFDGFDKT